MTIHQSLKSVSAYPVPSLAIENICEAEGLNAQDSMTMSVHASKSYKRARAMVYLWLAEAPNVTQGGISYSFSDTERSRFRMRADELLGEAGEDSENNGYGYMGSDL